MSTLTKIFVVIMVVVSLVSAVVFFNMATVPTNWRYHYDQERAAYKALNAKCSELTTKLERTNRQLTAKRRQLLDSLADTQGELRAKEADLAAAETKIAELQSSLGLINADLSTVKAELKEQRSTINRMTKELNQANARNNDLRAEKIALADDLSEARKSLELLEHNLMTAQNKLEDAKAQNEQMNKKLRDLERIAPDAVAAAESSPIAPPGISGTVTTVRGNLASINVGSAHGVKEGMELIIYRGDQFVGHLKIEQVEVNEAAGIVINKRLDPSQGDKITSPSGM